MLLVDRHSSPLPTTIRRDNNVNPKAKKELCFFITNSEQPPQLASMMMRNLKLLQIFLDAKSGIGFFKDPILSLLGSSLTKAVADNRPYHILNLNWRSAVTGHQTSVEALHSDSDTTAEERIACGSRN